MNAMLTIQLLLYVNEHRQEGTNQEEGRNEASSKEERQGQECTSQESRKEERHKKVI